MLCANPFHHDAIATPTVAGLSPPLLAAFDYYAFNVVSR